MMAQVLVVDDDEAIREVVQETLELEGFHVRTATNGREALDEISRFAPLLVLLDMRMPVLSGWDVARELQQRRVAVPIVVMTAAQDAGRWAREINAAGYLAKPFDIGDLIDTVERFVTAS